MEAADLTRLIDGLLRQLEAEPRGADADAVSFAFYGEERWQLRVRRERARWPVGHRPAGVRQAWRRWLHAGYLDLERLA